MKRFFSSLLLLVTALIVGFWLGKTDALQGTWVGDTLSGVVEKIPSPETVKSIIEGEGSFKKITPYSISRSKEPVVISEPEKEINDEFGRAYF